MTLSNFACLDFANSYAYGGVNTPTDYDAGTITAGFYSIFSNLNDVVFHLCHDGTNSAACSFPDVQVSFRESRPDPSLISTFLWGTSSEFKVKILMI